MIGSAYERFLGSVRVGTLLRRRVDRHNLADRLDPVDLALSIKERGNPPQRRVIRPKILHLFTRIDLKPPNSSGQRYCATSVKLAGSATWTQIEIESVAFY